MADQTADLQRAQHVRMQCLDIAVRTHGVMSPYPVLIRIADSYAKFVLAGELPELPKQ